MMSSGVVADRLLADLYLTGAKAPVSVTNHQSNCVRFQAGHAGREVEGNQSTHFIQGSKVTRYYTKRDAFSAERRSSSDNCISLPSVNKIHYNNNSSVRFPEKQKNISHLSDNEIVFEVTSFPPARQTSSLVTMGVSEHISRENQSFGNLGREQLNMLTAESSNDEDEEGCHCPSKGHRSLDQAFQISPCSRKENLSPHPPGESKKKKVKRKRKLKSSKQKRFISIKKGLVGTKQTADSSQESSSKVCPSTAPAFSQRTNKIDSPSLTYCHKPGTAQSTPNLPQSFAQRQEVCRSIYTRQGRSVPSRSRTLPTVANYTKGRCHSMERTSSSIDVQPNVLGVKLSECTNLDHLSSEETLSSTEEEAPVSRKLRRLIKIYLSEKQSGLLRDVNEGTEYPCAPPATPTPDQLRRYRYIPSMTDVKAQRTVKNKLHALERAEHKKLEKQRGKREKAELQVMKDNTKVLKQRQRQEIYALNAIMTELEYNRFVTFCLGNEIDPS